MASDFYPVSPSALNQAAECGWAHEYDKVHKLRPPSLSPSLLIGTIIHQALESWALDRSQDLVELTKKAWRDKAAGTPLTRVVKGFEAIAAEAAEVQARILRARPEITAVTRTKDWKESDVATRLWKYDQTAKPFLDKDEYDWDSKSFTESYTATLTQVAAYQEHYKDHPDALLTEVGFNVVVDGVKLRGFVDAVELVVSEDGEPLYYLLLDYKTYTQEPHELKDFTQLVTYYMAAEQQLEIWLEDAGYRMLPDLPIKVGLDLTSLLQRYIYTPNEHHKTIALDIARTYAAYRDNQIFLPNFKGKCDWCKWRELCLARLQWKHAAA